MKVLVMAVVADNLHDLQIVMVADRRASPVVTLKGMADSRKSNPYCVYGDAVAKFTGRDKFDTNINVFCCTSGHLEGWS